MHTGVIIKRYRDINKTEWNDFVNNSKMPMFMFDRNFMDYHRDRFIDHSLMFYNNNQLIALFPSNELDGVLISHGGLTYGGLITGEKMKQEIMIQCLNCLIEYAKEHCIKKILYKTIPLIYWKQAAEEDQYALMVHNAKLITVEASTVINLYDPYEISKLRKRKVKQAEKLRVGVRECFLEQEYNRFISLQNEVLTVHHGIKAVHTGDELFKLHQSFPNNIRLFIAEYEGRMVAGTVIFEYENVIHTQYLASNDEGRNIGALDYIIFNIIESFKGRKHWLDFGISTEDGGTILNKGLIFQKEGFGGRTIVYKKWMLEF